MNIYKQWTIFSLSYLLLYLTSVIIFNYSIDTRELFRVKNELISAVNDILSGKMIAGTDNLNEHQLQLLLIKKIQKMDFITIGSSRSLNIKKEFISKSN